MKMAEHDSELAKGHCEWKIPWHKRKKKFCCKHKLIWENTLVNSIGKW